MEPYSVNICKQVDSVWGVFAGGQATSEGHPEVSQWICQTFFSGQSGAQWRSVPTGTAVDVHQWRGEGCRCSSQRGWIWGHRRAYWHCQWRALVWLSITDEVDRSSMWLLVSHVAQILSWFCDMWYFVIRKHSLSVLIMGMSKNFKRKILDNSCQHTCFRGILAPLLLL